jgi:hypothetical protein
MMYQTAQQAGMKLTFGSKQRHVQTKAAHTRSQPATRELTFLYRFVMVVWKFGAIIGTFCVPKCGVE